MRISIDRNGAERKLERSWSEILSRFMSFYNLRCNFIDSLNTQTPFIHFSSLSALIYVPFLILFPLMLISALEMIHNMNRQKNNLQMEPKEGEKRKSSEMIMMMTEKTFFCCQHGSRITIRCWCVGFLSFVHSFCFIS